MGNQSTVRLEGDDYQHLYSWYEALQLLDDDSVYDHAWVEHPAAGSADDVTLHPKEGLPVAPRFMQVKWHTDHRQAYSFASLLEVQTGARSLFEKLFDSWKALKASQEQQIEVWLVSNWNADANSLGKFLKDSYSLSEDFYTDGPRSEAGRARNLWTERLDTEPETLFAFCREVRFLFGLGSLLLTKMVDDAMRGHGLRTGKAARELAVMQVREWITEGAGRRITRKSIQDAIARRGLKAVRIEEPKVCLWVHAWAKQPFNHRATVERDWCAHYSYGEKTLPSPQTWKGTLWPDLKNACAQVTRKGEEKLIDIRGFMPMTLGLAVGRAFPKALGYTLRVEQSNRHTNTTELWRSDALASPDRSLVPAPLEEDSWSASGDILLALCLSADPSPLLQSLYRRGLFGRLRAAFIARPHGGPGQTALRGEGDACALALQTKDFLQAALNRYTLRRIHLLPVAPLAFCIFLGQFLTGIGPVVTYEIDKNRRYQRSLTIPMD